MQCCDGTSNEPLRRLITVTDCWILDDSQGQRWLKKKKKQNKKNRGTCCSLRPSEMTGQTGEWTVNSHPPLPLRIQLSLWSWHHQYATSKPPGSALERCGRVCVCVCVCVCLLGVCLCVWLITHLCPPSEPRPFSPFCAPGERGRREAHLDMRSQIIHLTLRQRGLDGAQECKIEGEGGEGKKKKKKKWRRKGEKQTREWAVWTAK